MTEDEFARAGGHRLWPKQGWGNLTIDGLAACTFKDLAHKADPFSVTFPWALPWSEPKMPRSAYRD